MAPLVVVTSERQLPEEFRTISDGLEEKLPWEQRLTSLLRLEGLIKGGAAAFPSFVEMLPSLNIPLSVQLQDRRSSISRQACHVISVLLNTFGAQIEPTAAYLQPIVFKAQGMSITIVTEASDACCRTIIQCCPSSRLLPLLCSTVRTHKNTKLRASAAEYLLLAVREWDPVLLDRQSEGVEASIMAAAQDAAVETRETGRSAFVAYYSKRPTAAQAMLRKLPDSERALKEKLQTAVKQTLGSMEMAAPQARRPRPAAVQVAASQQHPRQPSSSSQQQQQQLSPQRPPAQVTKLSLPSPRPATTSREPTVGFSSARRAPSSLSPSSAAATVPPPRTASARAPSPKSTRVGGGGDLSPSDPSSFKMRSTVGRRSMGGAALRVPPPPSSSSSFTSNLSSVIDGAAAAEQQQQQSRGGGAGAPPKRCFASPTPETSSYLRQSMEVDDASYYTSTNTVSRAVRQPVLATTLSSTGGRAAARAPAGRVFMMVEADEREAMPFSTAVETLTDKKSGLDWSAKLELYEAVQAAIEEGSTLHAVDTTPESEFIVQFAALLGEGISETHFKVAAGALQTLSAALRCPQLSPALGVAIDAFAPALYVRVTDAKDQLRQLAGEATDLLPRVMSREVVMHGLTAALDATKVPKVLSSVMNSFTDVVIAAALKGKDVSQSGAGRSLLMACLSLATHKHPEVRQSALSAIAAVHFTGENGAMVVRTALEVLPPDAVDAIKRGIAQASNDGGVVFMEIEHESTPPPPPVLKSLSPRPPFQVASSSTTPPPFSCSPPVSPTALSIPVGDRSSPLPPALTIASPASSVGGGLASARSLDMRSPTPLSPPLATAAAAAAVKTPVSARTATPPRHHSRTASPALRAVLMEMDAKDEAKGSPGVQITADATFNVQCTVGAAQWAPAETEELTRVLRQLQPTPTTHGMTEALSLALQLEFKDRAALCSAVQEGLMYALENGGGGGGGAPNDEEELLEVSLRTFAELAGLVPLPALEAGAPGLLRPLLLAQGSGNEGVAFAAEKCAQQVMGALSPVAALSMLIPLLPRADKRPPFEGERAVLSLGVLRLLRMITPALSNAQMSAVLPPVMEPMCVCYSSANAELRRAAVDCIVSLHLKLGDDVMRPHIDSMSTAQVKLVEVYVERAKKLRGVSQIRSASFVHHMPVAVAVM